MSGTYLSRREVDKQYRPKGFGLSPGLQRARAPYRLRNALTGLFIGSFVVGVYLYSVTAVKQDSFDDVDEEAKALLSARLEDGNAQQAAAAAAAAATTTSSPSTSAAPIVTSSAPAVVGPEAQSPSTSAVATQPTPSEEAAVRGVLARWLLERSPSALHPVSKTLIWGAPPVDRVGRLAETSEKRT